MRYLRKRGKRYHFRKRISEIYRPFFHQEYIQIALKTDSETIAIERAKHFNRLFEEFLYSVPTIDDPAHRLNEVILRCQQSGFGYAPMQDLLNDRPTGELLQRLRLSAQDNTSAETAAAVLGNGKDNQATLQQAKEAYFAFEQSNKTGYSVEQMRKWKNTRNNAIANFIKVVDNKLLDDITREDVLSFRSWWAERVKNGYSANTANKQFSYIRQIIHHARDNGHCSVEPDPLFKKIALKDTQRNKRLAFSSAFIQDQLLDPGNYSENEECFLFVCAMADTGARIIELVGLSEEDILLGAKIPHIKIRPNAIRELKTPQSERDIPLVGSSLYAFTKLGGPFRHYQGKASSISSAINKYARENKLFPTKDHSLYSLRHSFEDRLTAIEINEKIQAALMGHKYSRPRYGNGPTLEQKYRWLEKIAFDVSHLAVA